MTNYRDYYAIRHVGQDKPLPGMIENSAGGFAYGIDNWTRLDRFLVLGSEGGTYYVSEQTLTVENAKAVQACIAEDGIRTVSRIVMISKEGRAPKNDPALFALALCAAAKDVKTRQEAFKALPLVARTATHLFHFVHFMEGFRGWGRGARRAVANWYAEKGLDALGYQAIKYKSRDGWSHRDLLRLAHPKTDPQDALRRRLYDWICRPENVALLPQQIEASLGEITPEAIREFRLPREVVPTDLLDDPKIWDALLQDMPMTAMIRTLGKMTQVGLLKARSAATTMVVKRLTNESIVKLARVHPVGVLMALRTYQQGHGFRGKLEWEPVARIVDALDEAFYLAFKNVEPTNKRLMLALDVSGSMSQDIAGTFLTAREGAAAMALATARTEPDHEFVAFTSAHNGKWKGKNGMGFWGSGFIPLAISPRQRLDDVLNVMSGIPHGGTDCALPMLYALDQKIQVDAFVIYTDSETWAGNIHPTEALKRYRNEMGIPAKLVVVGMTSNGFSIAHPDDAGMLDVVGFDTAVPNVIADFLK